MKRFRKRMDSRTVKKGRKKSEVLGGMKRDRRGGEDWRGRKKLGRQ